MRTTNYFLIAIIILFFHNAVGQGVAINNDGTNPHISAILDVKSTTQGILVPRMTTEQRNSISTLTPGLLVYDTDLETFIFYMSSGWLQLNASQPGADPGTYYFLDNDNDGFGNIGSPIFVASQSSPPSGYVSDSTDCDDTDGDIYPDATEICDGKDNDCNPATVDGSGETPTIVCLDHGVCYGVAPTCAGSEGWICDYGSSFEIEESTCDGVDNDCDGQIDEAGTCSVPYAYTTCQGQNGCFILSCEPGYYDCNGIYEDGCETSTAQLTIFYRDQDDDGYGNDNITLQDCSESFHQGYVTIGGDCDDADADVNPSAPEFCNSVDDDCDQEVDESDAVDASTWYTDNDGDSYGNPDISMQSCIQESGWVTDNNDCDDSDVSINPGATEVCNGIDDNCNGLTDEGFSDTDGDQFPDCLDDDDDNDGVLDVNDNCPLVYNPGQSDTDGDGIGDVCDND